MRTIFALLAFGIFFFGCLGQAPMADDNRSGADLTANQTPAGPTGAVVYRDIEYAEVNGTRLLLDLYIPQGETGVPLIVYVHGGGWMGGDKEGCPMHIATENGFALACVNYRLSNESLFPAQIQDVKASVRWLRANGEGYGLETERIGVWGDSAGGHLSALLGTSGGVDALDGDYGTPNQSGRVQAVVDYFGPVDFSDVASYEAGYFEYTMAAEKLIGGPIAENPEMVAMADPRTYASADDPPFLIIHGTNDTTVPLNQSMKLHEALKAQGVDATLIVVEGGGHGFAIRDADGHLTTEYNATMEFFRGHLR